MLLVFLGASKPNLAIFERLFLCHLKMYEQQKIKLKKFIHHKPFFRKIYEGFKMASLTILGPILRPIIPVSNAYRQLIVLTSKKIGVCKLGVVFIPTFEESDRIFRIFF